MTRMGDGHESRTRTIRKRRQTIFLGGGGDLHGGSRAVRERRKPISRECAGKATRIPSAENPLKEGEGRIDDCC